MFSREITSIAAHWMWMNVSLLAAEDPCSSEFQPLELTGNSGSFTSANYPINYDNNADCQWRITAVGTNAVSQCFKQNNVANREATRRYGRDECSENRSENLPMLKQQIAILLLAIRTWQLVVINCRVTVNSWSLMVCGSSVIISDIAGIPGHIIDLMFMRSIMFNKHVYFLVVIPDIVFPNLT